MKKLFLLLIITCSLNANPLKHALIKVSLNCGKKVSVLTLRSVFGELLEASKKHPEDLRAMLNYSDGEGLNRAEKICCMDREDKSRFFQRMEDRGLSFIDYTVVRIIRNSIDRHGFLKMPISEEDAVFLDGLDEGEL